MTPHLEAKLGDYAPTVLMPGDPLRAKWIAETFLQDAKIVNSVRNCLGYTGTYNGKPVSVQASGMGQASLGIYSTELFKFYGVEKIIRVGTCGSFVEDLEVGHIILAMSSYTENSMSRDTLHNWTFNPCCSYELLNKAVDQLKTLGVRYTVGAISSTDWFYKDNDDWWKILRDHGVLGVDMETHILYHIAMKNKKHALTINTVSDNLATGKHMSSTDRATSLNVMVKTILEGVL
jgi:purine-nucleoside phosphorylase